MLGQSRKASFCSGAGQLTLGAEGRSPRSNIFVRYKLTAIGRSNALLNGCDLPFLHGKELLDRFSC